MSALAALCRAICVRQAERENLYQPPMEEMWVLKDTWEAVKRDIEFYMTPTRDPKICANTCMGVTIHIIGEDE